MGYTILSNFSIKSTDRKYIETSEVDLYRNFFIVSNNSRYKTNKYNTIVDEIKNMVLNNKAPNQKQAMT